MFRKIREAGGLAVFANHHWIEWISDEYLYEDFVPDEEPKYEVGPTIGRPRAGKAGGIDLHLDLHVWRFSLYFDI